MGGDAAVSAADVRSRERFAIFIAEEVVARPQRRLFAGGIGCAAGENPEGVVNKPPACTAGGRLLSSRRAGEGPCGGAGPAGDHHVGRAEHHEEREHAEHDQQQHAAGLAAGPQACGHDSAGLSCGEDHHVTLRCGAPCRLPLRHGASCSVVLFGFGGPAAVSVIPQMPLLAPLRRALERDRQLQASDCARKHIEPFVSRHARRIGALE